MQVANCLLAGGWGADTAVRTLRVPESCGGDDVPADLGHAMGGNGARLSSRLARDLGRWRQHGARRRGPGAPDRRHRARPHHRHAQTFH